MAGAEDKAPVAKTDCKLEVATGRSHATTLTPGYSPFERLAQGCVANRVHQLLGQTTARRKQMPFQRGLIHALSLIAGCT